MYLHGSANHHGEHRRLPSRAIHGGTIQFLGQLFAAVYPVHLRGTGESFAANIGGRAIGVGFWGVTNVLAYYCFNPVGTPLSFSYAAATTGLFVFALGSLLSFFLPEPKPGGAED